MKLVLILHFRTFHFVELVVAKDKSEGVFAEEGLDSFDRIFTSLQAIYPAFQRSTFSVHHSQIYVLLPCLKKPH